MPRPGWRARRRLSTSGSRWRRSISFRRWPAGHRCWWWSTTRSGLTGRPRRCSHSFRIESDPVVLLAAAREGYDSVLLGTGLPEHRVAGLDEAAAAELLDASAPHLPLVVRAQVLREAAGNPLALLELPAAARADGLPLTARLERAFAGRVAELPEETRFVLLVASLNDADDLGEVLQASGQDLDAVAPATEASIVDVDLHTIRFRHPLIRSAVTQSASLAERRHAHQALAGVLDAQPDRRAWQRAALLSGEHEDVALELDAAAARARPRGALAVA